jgi:hypothetical protein
MTNDSGRKSKNIRIRNQTSPVPPSAFSIQ